ncbi:MAG: sulfite exporter TauE/SafE family protein [Pirellulaceae bacterium]
MLQSAWGAYAFRRVSPESFRHSKWVFIPGVVGGLCGAWVANDRERTPNGVGNCNSYDHDARHFGDQPVTMDSGDGGQRKSQRTDWKHPHVPGDRFLWRIHSGRSWDFLTCGLVLVAHYSLKDANAIKLAVVTLISVPSIIVFAVNHQIHYGLGLLMAVFQVIGAMVGVRLAKRIPNINVWIHRLLIVLVSVSALKLFGIFDMFYK